MVGAFVDERGAERWSMYAKAVDERKAGAGKIFRSVRSLHFLGPHFHFVHVRIARVSWATFHS